MKKRNFLFRILVLGLLTASCIGFQTAMASPMVMVDQPWWRTTGVNQPVEFTANATGGTPPYTFQWYTTYLDPAIPSGQWHTVMVPDSNSSTFKFAASIPGRYGISIRLSDSKGEGEYQSFQPMGIVVTVQTSPVHSLHPHRLQLPHLLHPFLDLLHPQLLHLHSIQRLILVHTIRRQSLSQLCLLPLF